MIPAIPLAEDTWRWAALAHLAVLVAMLAAPAVDHRVLDGANVWVKPAKFAFALGVHYLVLMWVAGTLSAPWRAGSLLAIVALVSSFAGAGEMVYIGVQAARRAHSHFNLSTPIYQLLYSLMAIGAVLIIGGAGVLGVVAAVDREADLGPAVRTGVVLGLVGGTVLTLISAFTMGGRLDHHVGVEAVGAPRMPLTGWSLSVGDLRVSHFLATHMIQAVPLVGLAASRFPTVIGVPLVVLAAAAWTAATLGAWRGALEGRPPLTP